MSVISVTTTAPSQTVGNTTTVDVLAGGTTVAWVLNGAVENVSGGGVASANVENGGVIYVSSGGHALQTTLNSGYQVVSNGGVASGTTVVSGFEVVQGGQSISATVDAGGQESVSAGGITIGAVLSGGVEFVSNGGLASATTLKFGGLYVFGGGSATSATATSGGGVLVSAGGHVSASVIDATGYQSISSGGAATATVLNAGGYGYVAGGTTTGTMVMSGGVEKVEIGTAFQTTVSAGGVEIIYSGAAVQYTSVTLGGKIDLPFLTYVSSGSLAPPGNDLVTVREGASSTTLQLGGNYSGEMFTLSQEIGGSGTVLTLVPACYCRGTRILTGRGEIAVEDLVIGDLIATASGALKPLRWVGRRSYAGRFLKANPDLWPVLIRANALADGVPSRDLQVSPKHAIFIDGALVPARLLVNNATIATINAPEEVHYLHVELGDHDVIMAEGAAAESFVDDNSRGMFHNFAEYAALYPGSATAAPLYCAPRLTEGFALQAIRLRLADRAGLGRPGEDMPLRGCIDRVGGRVVEGWAQNPELPEVWVCLDIVVDGVVVAQTLANRHRDDLVAAGIGQGRHAFYVRLEDELTPVQRETLIVRRSSDETALLRLQARHQVA